MALEAERDLSNQFNHVGRCDVGCVDRGDDGGMLETARCSRASELWAGLVGSELKTSPPPRECAEDRGDTGGIIETPGTVAAP